MLVTKFTTSLKQPLSPILSDIRIRNEQNNVQTLPGNIIFARKESPVFGAWLELDHFDLTRRYAVHLHHNPFCDK